MAKMQLHFNGNFPLKKAEVKRILEVASEDKGLNDSLENLMAKTGLGNAKVGKIKSWAIRSGLVKDNYLTPEGKLVLKHDPYLQSIITDWLMHFYLSFGNNGLKKIPENIEEWGGWTYFIYTFLPENHTFTKDQLFANCIPIFEEKATEIPARFKNILRTYTEQQALANCQIIQETKTDTYQTGKVQLPNTYLIGYFLAKLWERDFNKETSVLTDDIINQKMGIAAVLGIQKEALQEHLNSLESLAIIEQRRTVAPYQIIRRWDNPLKLLEKAYRDNQ
ncbi:MAG: DUF4007 family protein [Nostocales cyanobacterium]|nr:MAG: DUF4007 family protein [Nostocales cyanobacterium]